MPSVGRSAAALVGDLLGARGRKLIANDVDPVSFEMAQFFWYLDASLAREELGWSPRDPMETLRDTIDDLRGVRAAS
jgi:dihydroflavonol-4-reductase